ncbi:MAG: zf-HC2 domain-containing protein [Atribacterota bacterium]
MQCHEVSQKISAFVDEELPLWEYREVARHLEICSRCRAEYRAFALIKVMAREIGKVTPKKIPERRVSLEHVMRVLRFRKTLWVIAILFGLLVGIFLILGWQRSLLDEQILNPNHLSAFSEDVLTRTQVRVETLELVTGEY